MILVDYVKDLETDHSEFFRWALNSMANVHIRDRRGKDTDKRVECLVQIKEGIRIFGHKPRNRHVEPSELKSRGRFSLRAFGGADTSVSDIWPPELRESISVVLSCWIYGDLLWQP